MNRVIVSGACGFIGGAVVNLLLDMGTEVYALVRPGFVCDGSRFRGAVNIIECDIKNILGLAERLPKHDVDAFYHFAWDGFAGDALWDYGTQIMNIKWVTDAVIAAAKTGCKKFIGAGSISQCELSVAEGQKAQGDKLKYYKTAKLAAEYMGRAAAAEHGIEFYWPIITNVYGEGEVSSRLINSMIRNLQEGKRQSLSQGNQIYDFIYITDAANAFYLIGEKGIETSKYIVGSGNAKPLKEFLAALRDVVSPGAELGFGEMDFNGIYLPKQAFDTGELVRDTGFRAKIDFVRGIELTAAWLKLKG